MGFLGLPKTPTFHVEHAKHQESSPRAQALECHEYLQTLHWNPGAILAPVSGEQFQFSPWRHQLTPYNQSLISPKSPKVTILFFVESPANILL